MYLVTLETLPSLHNLPVSKQRTEEEEDEEEENEEEEDEEEEDEEEDDEEEEEEEDEEEEDDDADDHGAQRKVRKNHYVSSHGCCPLAKSIPLGPVGKGSSLICPCPRSARSPARSLGRKKRSVT